MIAPKMKITGAILVHLDLVARKYPEEYQRFSEEYDKLQEDAATHYAVPSSVLEDAVAQFNDEEHDSDYAGITEAAKAIVARFRQDGIEVEPVYTKDRHDIMFAIRPGDLYTATLTNTGRQVVAFLGDECDYLPEEDTKWPNQ